MLEALIWLKGSVGFVLTGLFAPTTSNAKTAVAGAVPFTNVKTVSRTLLTRTEQTAVATAVLLLHYTLDGRCTWVGKAMRKVNPDPKVTVGVTSIVMLAARPALGTLVRTYTLTKEGIP